MPDRKQSIENFGLGQSGYTAGRVAGDPALERELEGRNLADPNDTEDQADDRGDDERFTGRGGPRWAPEPEPGEHLESVKPPITSKP